MSDAILAASAVPATPVSPAVVAPEVSSTGAVAAQPAVTAAKAPVETTTESAPAVEMLLKGEPAPEQELKLAFKEGSEPDTDLIEQFMPLAKELKLSNAAAQKLYDLYSSAQDKVFASHTERVIGWAAESRGDKEFGGAGFAANLAVADKALGRLGSPALRELLKATGLGNHPEIIRVFYQVGKVLPEDRLPGGPGNQARTEDKEAQLRAMFPNSPGMFPKP